MFDEQERVRAHPRQGPARGAWPLWLRLLIGFLLAVLLIAPLWLWRAELAQTFAARDQVAAQLRAAGAWGPLALIALIIAQTVIAPIPGQAVNLVAGYLYGLGWGLLYSWAGMVLGSALAMGLARFAGRPLVERLVSHAMLARLDRLAARGGWRFFALAFFVPGLPDDALCFVAGLTRLPLRGLVALCAVARVPGILAAVWLGAYAERLPWQAWAIGAGLAAAGLWVAWRYGERIQEIVLRRLK